MHRHTVSDTGDMASARSSRAQSFNSDRPSIASSVTFQMPTTVRPSPAYIAASVASQMVTDHHNAQLRDEDADSDELDNAVFSEQALALLNAFLDHLLFAFLSTARSPSLTAVRPAINEVLKPRLAREATEAADEELEGLLAGEDEDEFPAQNGKSVDKWDVEKVWKRTRLRIMVYTRLGELEDEDEEKYVQQERGLSMDDDDDEEAGLVSWASAIFLTSVIEYVAEQTLLVAGSAAFTRMAAKMKKMSQQQQLEHPEHPGFERLIIEESDVEKIALNAALGRLWRTWRKRVRSPISPMSPGRGIRPVSSFSSLHRRRTSHENNDEAFRGEHSSIPEHAPTETEIAANIPLPMGANDINEIEVPGLARTFEDDETSGMQTPVPRAQRPSSVFVLAPVEAFRRRTARPRPLSMPVPEALPFAVPVQSPNRRRSSSTGQSLPETPFETPFEYAPNRASYVTPKTLPVESAKGEQESELDGAESPQEADEEMVAFAASTGMGFGSSAIEPIKTDMPKKVDEEAETPSAGGYESEPKIMHSKRLSVEKTGPPGVIRTFSTRSTSHRSANAPVATPKTAQHAEGRSYLDDGPSDDDEYTHGAIGVARTSDVPIRTTPTPPVESIDKGKHVSHASHGSLGGYVEVHPRYAVPTSTSNRNTPTPDSKPLIPEQSGARKDSSPREVSRDDYPTSTTASPSRQQDISHGPRGASLPSLKEVDSHPNSTKQRTAVGIVAPQNGVSPGSPNQNPTYPGRETPASITDRKIQRVSTAGSMHSQRGGQHGSPSSEKATVKRVASTSSSKKSGSFTYKQSGRDSEASLRSQNFRGRMSEEDRERQFDTLVKGEETVKFTLTPQTVRDFDVSKGNVFAVVVY